MFWDVYRLGLLLCACLCFPFSMDMASSALLPSWHVLFARGLCGIPLPFSVHTPLWWQRCSCLAAPFPLCFLWVITCLESVLHIMPVLSAAWTFHAEPFAGEAGQGRGMHGVRVFPGPSVNAAVAEDFSGAFASCASLVCRPRACACFLVLAAHRYALPHS